MILSRNKIMQLSKIDRGSRFALDKLQKLGEI